MNYNILPFTVLAYEGPILRAYLEVMRINGLKPKKIIVLVDFKSSITKNKIFSLIPTRFLYQLTLSLNSQRCYHWLNLLKKKYSLFCNIIKSESERNFTMTNEFIDGMYSLKRYEDYSDLVEYLGVDSLKDPAIIRYLQKNKGTYLYTGGGIVPGAMLNIEDVKFLHIHPGGLPNIRGADGIFWSMLLNGYPAATLFYLDEGIDTGDIIKVKEFHNFSMHISSKDFEGISDKMLYRAVFYFVDPLLRANVLQDFINSGKFTDLDVKVQNKEEGEVFHFMHERLLKLGLNKVLNGESHSYKNNEIEKIIPFFKDDNVSL